MQEINVKIIYSVVRKEAIGIKHMIIVLMKSLIFLFPKLSGLLQFLHVYKSGMEACMHLTDKPCQSILKHM